VSRDRREFLALGLGGAAGAAQASPLRAQTIGPGRFKAVAFDAFPIFDPRPAFTLAETLFPDEGAALSNTWRTRQFEYQWLGALARKSIGDGPLIVHTHARPLTATSGHPSCQKIAAPCDQFQGYCRRSPSSVRRATSPKR
jgi:hypothetical protein